MTIVRYFAAVKAAAGVGEDQIEASTLSEALVAVRFRHEARFTDVLTSCSYIVDGAPVGARDHDTVIVRADSVVECLPPFAGG